MPSRTWEALNGPCITPGMRFELADVLEVASAKQRLRALVAALPKPLNAAGRELECRLVKD